MNLPGPYASSRRLHGSCFIASVRQCRRAPRAEIIPKVSKLNLHGQVRKHVALGGHVMSDNLAAYEGLKYSIGLPDARTQNYSSVKAIQFSIRLTPTENEVTA
jgi:hypothetical protein